MLPIAPDPDRRTVPRWRTWKDAVDLGHADPSDEVRAPQKPNSTELLRVQFDWETNRSVPFAGDFLGVAYANGERGVAREAAEFLVKYPSRTSVAARRLAEEVLREQQSGGLDSPDPPSVSVSGRYEKIRKLRAFIHDFPYAPLSYMDLAREYVALGQSFAAVKPVEIALALAPNNRFIIRSAARFFLHIDDRQRAHHILRTAPLVKSDPWLLGAEIAVASAAGQTSSLVKTGHQIVDSSKFAPFHISELASALGTLECETGNRRLVKRLLRRALIEPTENVVAQAGWISRQFGDFQLDRHLNTPRSYEARAWAYLLDGHWTDSVKAAGLWLRDEPFSKRAAAFGSWAALTTLMESERAAEFAKLGLITHPKDSLLLNNLAVALANLGKPKEALETFLKIENREDGDLTHAVYLATNGLIQFRLGSVEDGRRLYRMGIAEAREKKDVSTAVMAVLHLAREEAIHTPAEARRLIREVMEELPKLPKAQYEIAARFLEKLGMASE